MNVSDIINGLEQKERLFITSVADKIRRASVNYMLLSTNFLNPYQQNLVNLILHKYDDLIGMFEGGYPHAERKILIVRPTYYPAYKLQDFIRCLRITASIKGTKLSHSDFLGAILAIGIIREKVGDIVIEGKNQCVCFVSYDIADYIFLNLQKVRNLRVKVEQLDINNITLPEKQHKEFIAVISSLRLDAVISAAYKISRAQAAKYIKNKLVKVNWQVTDTHSKQLQVGDVISVRKHGRVILSDICGYTKKMRINVKFKKPIEIL